MESLMYWTSHRLDTEILQKEDTELQFVKDIVFRITLNESSEDTKLTPKKEWSYKLCKLD